MQCMKRGGISCDSIKCILDWDTSEVCKLCTMDSVLTALHALSNVEIREILLAGIPKKEKEDADFWISESFKDEETTSWRIGRPEFLLAVRLEHTKTALEKLKYPNFVYFRPDQLTLIDMHGGAHDSYMSLLYWIDRVRKGTATSKTSRVYMTGHRDAFNLSTTSESFLTDGIGFFSSSVYMGMGIPREKGYPITFSEKHKLTFQEKRIFEAYGFDPIKNTDDDC